MVPCWLLEGVDCLGGYILGKRRLHYDERDIVEEREVR